MEVDDRGYIYIVDRANTGMHILELTGDAKKMLSPQHQPDKGATKSASQNAAALIEMTAEQAVAQGILFAGNPDTVARQILDQMKQIGAGHFMGMFHIGNLHHDKVISSLNLFKKEIMPRLQ